MSTLRSVTAVVERILPDLFGYHLVIYSDYIGGELVESSRISHCLGISTRIAGDIEKRLVCDFANLPIEENTVDVMVLPHILDFAEDPHRLLREAERALIGEGHIVIISFNPWSFYGFFRALLRWRDGVPWRGKFIGQNRVKDWLQLLGFDIESAAKVGFRPPIQNPRVNRRLEFLEQLGAFCWPFLGNVSVLVAKKRVASVTPLKASWETRRRMVAGGVVEPTARNQRNLNKTQHQRDQISSS